MNTLYAAVMERLAEMGEELQSHLAFPASAEEQVSFIPPGGTRYLSEIADTYRNYDARAIAQTAIARKIYCLKVSRETITSESSSERQAIIEGLKAAEEHIALNLDPKNKRILNTWPEKVRQYKNSLYTYKVRD